MNGNEFCKRFQLASYFCRDFTNRHIKEELPPALLYNFALTERLQAESDKIVLNHQAFLKSQLVKLTPKEAAGILYKNEEIPVWVDLFVGYYDDNYTYIEVTFSEDYTNDESLLFHQKEGYPPFHAVGPTVPEGWKSIEEDGSFPFIKFH
ncbi:MAG: hypothetical protein NE328_25075 [Lentisphaeraceae bacterium]|nr:hypothetical protein [Lentisphaeraceae bacterium]